MTIIQVKTHKLYMIKKRYYVLSVTHISDAGGR